MSYQILGRAIKNEYLALGIYSTVFGGAWLATRGAGSKSVAAKPTTVMEAKASIPVIADSTEEEQFILNFIKEAEKEGVTAGH